MAIPRDPALDSSLALLREGYAFLPNRFRRLGTDAFETRLGGRRTVCLRGEDAARLFSEAPLTRKGALPPSVVTLLQDFGSVQMLDGAEHRHRKRLFVALLAPERAREFRELVRSEYERAAALWRRADSVVLLRAAEALLCRAACAWAGIRLDGDGPERTAELSAMIDGAGSVGPRNWRGQLLRRRTERWAVDLVRRVRAGGLEASPGTALREISLHRAPEGSLLAEEVAAVELINVLRPTVAVAYYVAFAALALHGHPEQRPPPDDEEALERFVHEVRRFYPFFPAIAGVARREFEWRGHRFPEGRRVLLDLYGTNRDPRLWEAPDEFRSERFRGWDGNPFTLVPQGTGDHLEGHRCPGEWLTIETAKESLRALAALDYEVPPQELRVPLSRMPARPRSGFVIRLLP